MSGVLLFPDYTNIGPHLLAELTELIAEGLRHADRAALLSEPSWETVAFPLSEIDDRIGRLLAPVRQMHSVETSNVALSELYESMEQAVVAYSSAIGQHQGLFRAYQYLGLHADALTPSRKVVVEHALRDFRLSGVDLGEPERARVAELQLQLSELGRRFEEAVVVATDRMIVDVEGEDRVRGIPMPVVEAARMCAEKEGKVGYRFVADMPTVSAVLGHAEDRALREKVYRLHMVKGAPENGPRILEILALRTELAHLLGYADYASYALVRKMAELPETVEHFLSDLTEGVRPMALREYAELEAYWKGRGYTDLLPWDTSFAAEELRKERIGLAEEVLRPYFPLPHVFSGLVSVLETVYGVSVHERPDVSLWHSDARLYEVRRSETEEVIGAFSVDLYARRGKRGGAWMDECVSRYRTMDGTLHLPIAFLNCNFTAPVGDTATLLSFREVETLFHETGHVFHHLLTQEEDLSVSGIAGVEWDAVEMPSQYFEHFAAEPEGLARISSHIETGASLPPEYCEQISASRRWHAGLALMRQNEFSLVDVSLHRGDPPRTEEELLERIQTVRDHVRVTPVMDGDRGYYSFTHIFGGEGGYASGYYGYKWAEVLAEDVWEAFVEEADWAKTGKRLINTFLSVGGSGSAAEHFLSFRGRPPRPDALYRSMGMTEKPTE